MNDDELDVLVAEKIMGWTNVHGMDGGLMIRSGTPPGEGGAKLLPGYSLHIGDAWLVVEEMGRRGYRVEMADRGHGLWLVGFGRISESGFPGHQSKPAARALCLAALRALGVEVPE